MSKWDDRMFLAWAIGFGLYMVATVIYVLVTP